MQIEAKTRKAVTARVVGASVYRARTKLAVSGMLLNPD